MRNQKYRHCEERPVHWIPFTGSDEAISSEAQRLLRHSLRSWLAMTMVVVMLFVFVDSASAVWIWTPKTKKWENPKYATKDTPKAQFEYALGFFNTGDYKSSQREFKRLIKAYPNSEFAPEAQFYSGFCLQKQEEYYQAFLAYQKVIETYPYSERVDQIIAEQYNIGKMFYDGYKSKVLGMAVLPSIDKAIEALSKVVENSPYGKYADSAQYYLGLSYKKMLQHKEAIEAFQKLLDEYPNSPLAEDAKFQIGQCYAQAAPKPAYDQLSTEESIREFKELLDTSPDGKKTQETVGLLDKLKERKAESVFETARFYEKLKKYKSAQLYYTQILNEYPKASWAAKALERLEVLKAKRKIE